jgi:hypothetical protein
MSNSHFNLLVMLSYFICCLYHLQKNKRWMEKNPKSLMTTHENFQTKWVAMLPWAKGLMSNGGFI